MNDQINRVISVSVVIPNYNCLPTLPRALESINEQGVEDISIIVVDDGSDDGSREWLAQQQDIEVLYTERVGASAARNKAIAHSKAEYIAFLDADDFWLAGKLKAQLDLHIQNPQVTFSFTDYMHVTEDGESIIGCFDYWPRFRKVIKQEARVHQFKDFLPLLYAENMVGTSTVIAKRQTLLDVGGFDESLKSASDWDLWMKMAVVGEVALLNENTCHYITDRAGAISRNQSKRLEAMRYILDKHKPAMTRHKGALKAGYSRWWSSCAEYCRSENHYGQALKKELISLLLSPQKQKIKTIAADTMKILG